MDQTESEKMWAVVTMRTPDAKGDSLEKTLMLGKIEGKRRRGRQRMRWLDGINGHEFEQTLGDSEGQGSLGSCSPCSHRGSDTTLCDWTTTRETIHRSPISHRSSLLLSFKVPRPDLWQSGNSVLVGHVNFTFQIKSLVRGYKFSSPILDRICIADYSA